MIKVPGFIDLQVNGFLTVNFSSDELTLADIVKATTGLREAGTVGFLATVITSSEEVYARNLPLIVEAMQLPEIAGTILGIHIEGPFISLEPGAVGAHNPAWVKRPDIELFKKMQEWADGHIKLLTLAAESEGAAELTRYAAEHGVTVSLGHQLATAADLARCAAAGAKLLTHLGNGIPNMINRHSNPLIAGLAEDALTAMIISDGHHLPPALLKIMTRTKGCDRLIITSDASSLAGMPPGKYYAMGNDVVIEESGLLHNPKKQCLVGSSATIMQCVNYFASLNLVTPEELVKMALDNPLKMINLTRDELNLSQIYQFSDAKKEFIPA